MINITKDNKKDCCGCTACEMACPKHCISMQRDNEGFLYPVVNTADCINCNLCEKVCPVINSEKTDDLPKRAYIVRNKDEKILKQSTSGGAVTPLCRQILAQNGVLYGGAFGDDYYVKHIRVTDEAELYRFRGSKYVQSDMTDTYSKVKDDLNDNRVVMFAGTPCQVEGLLRYLKKPYENLFTVDFICRAVPSPMVWENYRKFMEQKYNSKITYASFRDKIYGYHSSSLALKFKNGKSSYENTKTDYMLKSFFDGVTARPSCFDCKFRKAKRVSDLTVFDCWNITRYVPELKDDDKGYTAVFVQSEKGQKMLDSVKDEYIMYDADVALLVKNDGHMALENPPKNKNRDKYFELLNSGMTIDRVVKETIPVKTSRKIFGKFRGTLYKTGLLNLLKKLK